MTDSDRRDGPREDDGGSRTSLNFIHKIIEDDLASGKHDHVQTRFPPEPNGYLHIGHAKAICVNFGTAEKYGGVYNLRFDDTNPTREDVEYVDSIQEDIRWLGFDWGDRLFYASDYFEQLYEYAVQLTRDGKAYVDSLSAEEIRKHRGTLTEPGQESPYRGRSVEENLDLFERMRKGEFDEGQHVLRAKIDMSSPNMNLRDPVLYRVLKAHHHRTGDRWCIYPMYDFAHGQCDSIERVNYSLCSIEFENHRPLYDWFIRELGIYPSRQIEFARLKPSYTIMSKRKLLQLVDEKLVSGWDDPRLPTLRGLRRRGYTPKAIREFCERMGVAKVDSMVDLAVLEDCLRDDLNQSAARRMAVLRPLKLVIENYPEGETEEIEAINNPEDESAGIRKLPFSRTLYIERDDFMEDPPKKFFRLAPGREVRLRYAYFVKCTDVIKDDSGEIVELRCSYDPATRGGDDPTGDKSRKKAKTLHWVCAEHAIEAPVRLYDHLFGVPKPDEVDAEAAARGEDFKSNLNPNSLEELESCKLEPSLRDARPGERFQFERLGYFCADSEDSRDGAPVFNRTVTLRDQWARIEKQRKNAKKR